MRRAEPLIQVTGLISADDLPDDRGCDRVPQIGVSPTGHRPETEQAFGERRRSKRRRFVQPEDFRLGVGLAMHLPRIWANRYCPRLFTSPEGPESRPAAGRPGRM